jgi:DNA-binding transcriptional ArsR family regulator
VNGVKLVIHPKRRTRNHLFGNVKINEFSLQSGACGNPNDQSESDKDNERQIRNAVAAGAGWPKADAITKVAVLVSWEGEADELAALLSDPNPSVRAASCYALAKCGCEAEQHAEKLEEHIGKIPCVSSALINMGRAGAVVAAKQLYNEDVKVRREAKAILDEICEPADHRQTWTDVGSFASSTGSPSRGCQGAIHVDVAEELAALRCYSNPDIVEAPCYALAEFSFESQQQAEELGEDIGKAPSVSRELIKMGEAGAVVAAKQLYNEDVMVRRAAKAVLDAVYDRSMPPACHRQRWSDVAFTPMSLKIHN